MENVQMNMTAVRMLEQWDPLNLGEDAYDTETADIVAALQSIENIELLATYMQSVYELSYEVIIPIEQCKEMAEQLIHMKERYSCM